MKALHSFRPMGQGKRHPWTKVPSTALPPKRDLRSALTHLFQRACSLRGLRLITPLLFFLVVCSCLSGLTRRPYTSDLVVKSIELMNGSPLKFTTGADEYALTGNEKPRATPSPTPHVMDCNIDTRRLNEIRDRYKLDDQIEYTKRYIRFTRKPIERPSYTSLQQDFLSDEGFKLLDLSRSHHIEEKCHEPLDVAVTKSLFPGDVDLSDFLFAMSTKAARVMEGTTIKEWAYWLTDANGRSNGGKLLLRLLDASDPELVAVGQRLADVGIDAEVTAMDSRLHRVMAVRYLDLVPMLFNHADSRTKKWLVLCDDDTFFTTMNSLTARFKQFDHTKPHYIGALSEDIIAVKTHGSQAFGGGGVFLSRPMAEIISKARETCTTKKEVKKSNSGWGPQGDILLRNCIYENTDVRLTHLRGLWQLDLAGDVSGFYEGGHKPYSVHHFKGEKNWHRAYPLNTTKIAYTCGEDCPYQRFVTKDGFVISNGYSVAQYPQGIEFDLNQVERTFRPLLEEHGWNFDYVFGPQRPSMHNTGNKIAWELRDSSISEDGSVTQVYIRKKGDDRWTTKEGRPMKMLDGMIELVWIPG